MRFELEQGTGECRVGADGLYWVIDAVCARSGPDAPRLYCDGGASAVLAGGRQMAPADARLEPALPITPQSVFTLSPPDLVPYDPSQPLPQIENLPDLIPIQFNGKLYLKQTQPVP